MAKETENVDVEAEDETPQPASAKEKFLFAETGLTVHILMDKKVIRDILTQEDILYDVKSRVLAPGDIVSLNELPPYLVKDLKAGKVAGAKIVDREEASRLNEEAVRIRMLADQTIGVESDMITEIVTERPS